MKFEVVDATVVLNKNLAPVSDRVFVIDPFAQGEAMKQRAFQDLSWGGASNMETFMDGTIGEKSKRFGFAFAMDQNIPTLEYNRRFLDLHISWSITTITGCSCCS